MVQNTEMPRRIFYLVVSLCAAIIVLNSFETMIRVKDSALFDIWVNNPSIASQLVGKTSEEMFSTYLSMCLSTYFIRVITPIGLGLHSYYALTRSGMSKMYVYLWSVMLIGTLLLSMLGGSLLSIFFILSCICYVALVGVMIYIKRIINYREML